MSLFGFSLLPASFRGVPFGVVEQSTVISRRLAVHEYPDSEQIWTEDMGRGATRYRLRGFLLENDIVYSGGPIQAQRLLLLAAGKAEGPSLLTHPTLGLLNVSCETVSVAETLDGATYSTIEWSFVEAGAQSTGSLSLDAPIVSGALVAAVAIASVAVRTLALSGQGSAGTSSGALPVVSTQWTTQISAAGADATALSRLATALPGNLGRFSKGATSGYLSAISTVTPATLDDLVTLAAAQRAAIAVAVARVAAVISGLTVGSTDQDYSDAAAAAIAALASACADPTDALRLLTRLLVFQPSGIEAASAPGAATTALWQRLVALEVVRAGAAYEPQSYEDAFAQMVRVTGVLDVAITSAGNTGQDDLFAALRALRSEVVRDFRSRGAALTHVRTFALPASLPAIVLAQRLYRDAARADELVGEAGKACVSPLFMPRKIQALAA